MLNTPNILSKIMTYDNYSNFKTNLTSLILDLSGSLNTSIEETVRKYPKDFVDVILQILSENQQFEAKSVYNFLLELNSKLEKIQILELTLSIQPEDRVVQAIYTWCTNNIDADVILRINKNPLLLGGAVLTYNGNYLDLSLSKKLKTVLTEYKRA